MLTYNSRKPSGAESSMKTERGKGAPNGAMAAPVSARFYANGARRWKNPGRSRGYQCIRQKYPSALESDEWDLVRAKSSAAVSLRNYATYLGLGAHGDDRSPAIDRRRIPCRRAGRYQCRFRPLPPERSVDYRPKDVALRDETEELAPCRINLVPFMLLLGVAAVATLVWWSVTQFSDEISGASAVQEQVVAWQQPAPTPEPIATSATDALPESLLRPRRRRVHRRVLRRRLSNRRP